MALKASAVQLCQLGLVLALLAMAEASSGRVLMGKKAPKAKGKAKRPPPAPPLPNAKASSTRSGYGPFTTEGFSPLFAFPAGGYAQKISPRNWANSPWQFAWEKDTPIVRHDHQDVRRMCLLMVAKPDWAPANQCATWLLQSTYKIALSAGAVLESRPWKECIRGTAVLRAGSGEKEVGVITWVSRATAKRDYAEVHVHGFGASDIINPGDKICLYVNPTVCPTIESLCGTPKGACAIGMWSGPDGKKIHQCAPSTTIQYP